MSEQREQLRLLIAQARAEGKWLWCHYQDLWFSPDALEREHAKGCFIWGAVNWQLRDPKERLAEATERLRRAESERDRIAEELRK